MNYNHHSKQKLGMLILDVKGNYYKQVYEYSKKYELLDDLDVLEQDLFDSLSGKKERNISFYDQALVSVKEKKLKMKKGK